MTIRGDEQGAPPSAGWPAVQRFVARCLGDLPRGQQPPPTPTVLKEWENTVLPAAAAGLIYGVTTQWAAERRRAGPVLPSVNLRMDRLFRISDAAIRHSLPMAGLAVIFLGVEALSAVHRGRDRLVLDSMYGGTTVACVYGAHKIIQTPSWPLPPLLQPMLFILGMCSIQGGLQWLQAKEKAKEAAAAAAEEEGRQRAQRAARRGDAASQLLAQLEQARQGGAAAPPRPPEKGGAGPQQQQQQQHGEQQAGPDEHQAPLSDREEAMRIVQQLAAGPGRIAAEGKRAAEERYDRAQSAAGAQPAAAGGGHGSAAAQAEAGRRWWQVLGRSS